MIILCKIEVIKVEGIINTSPFYCTSLWRTSMHFTKDVSDCDAFTHAPCYIHDLIWFYGLKQYLKYKGIRLLPQPMQCPSF